jgi:hypothetical protein
MTGANNSGATIIGTASHGTTAEGTASQVVIGDSAYGMHLGVNQTLKHLTLTSTAASEYGLFVASGKNATGTDIVIKDTTGYGAGISGTLSLTNFRITNCAKYPIVGGGTFTASYGIVDNNRAQSQHSGGTHVYNNIDFIGNDLQAVEIPSWAAAGTSVALNNCNISANSTTARNKYILDNNKAGATMTCNNCNWLPNGRVVDRGAADYRTRNVTLNSSFSKLPRFRTPNKKGILVIGMDDAENIAHIKVLAGKLAAYGYKGTFAINANLATINNSWADVATLANAGHEISSHTRSHSNLTSLDGIDITYAPGASGASAATVTISAGILTATVTGADHGWSKDLSTVNKIADLIVWINTNHGTKSDGATWTAAKHGTWDATAASNLADVSAQNCFNSAYHMQLDQTRYFAYEIAGSKTYIEDQIKANGGAATFECKTLIHPCNYTSTDTRTAIRSAGYIAGRLQRRLEHDHRGQNLLRR